MQNYQMLINGNWVNASNDQRFTTSNPATGEPLASIPEASAEDVDQAVQAAKQALNGEWGNMLPYQRGKVLRKLGDLLAQHSELLGKIESEDTGKLFQETRWQSQYIAEYYQFYAGCADKIHGETLPIDKHDLFVYTVREPIGVVAAIIPWNSQMFLAAVKIGPALAAGNTMVIKLSEHASNVMLEFGKLFAEAGIPDGVINLVTGHANPCGEQLTSHPDVAKIAFTGGATAAKHIIRNSTHNFAPVSLELGGKSPIIVFEDADIGSAVNGVVSAIFAASGQSCVAGSRLYVHHSIADEVINQLVTAASNINIGDPMAETTEMGPLCTVAQLEHISQQIEYAKQQGATIHYGGNKIEGAGYYFQPTIIECPQNDCQIVDTELFGPVLSVIRFTDEQQVIGLANDSKHGLAAGVFSQDSARIQRMCKALKSGIIWANTYRVISPVAPFGGFKHSGYGRESGMQAVYDYTQSKTIWINTSNKPLASQFVAR